MYKRQVDVGESLGYITIPKIDVNLPIYEGTSDDVLAVLWIPRLNLELPVYLGASRENLAKGCLLYTSSAACHRLPGYGNGPACIRRGGSSARRT